MRRIRWAACLAVSASYFKSGSISSISAGHTGCYACLQKWLEQPGRTRDCPQCRQVDVRLYRLQLDPELRSRKGGPGPSTQWSKRLVAWSTLYKLTAKVVGCVDKMDAAAPSSSIERAPREITRLVSALQDVDAEIPVRRIVVVDAATSHSALASPNLSRGSSISTNASCHASVCSKSRNVVFQTRTT
jgi:hypothetical protein